jgi:hypothetical protein
MNRSDEGHSSSTLAVVDIITLLGCKQMAQQQYADYIITAFTHAYVINGTRTPRPKLN